jgi:hypothetical protein
VSKSFAAYLRCIESFVFVFVFVVDVIGCSVAGCLGGKYGADA